MSLMVHIGAGRSETRLLDRVLAHSPGSEGLPGSSQRGWIEHQLHQHVFVKHWFKKCIFD